MARFKFQASTLAPDPEQRARARSQALASWIFGSSFAAFLIWVFVLAPVALPLFKQRILAIISALLAGLFSYFLTGGLVVGGKGNFGRLVVKGSSGAGAFILVLGWWLSPLSPVDSTDLIRLRVLTLDSQGVPVDATRVWTSVGGEPKQVAGGWEMDIPLSRLPPDHRITIHAVKESAFLSAVNGVKLGNEVSPVVTLRLSANPPVTVRGIVVDAKGHALEGVRVMVVGQEEIATTGTNGQFVLPAHAAEGQQVELHVEKAGYGAANQFHPAGAYPATLVLE